jgi:hypothetical protein
LVVVATTSRRDNKDQMIRPIGPLRALVREEIENAQTVLSQFFDFFLKF